VIVHIEGEPKKKFRRKGRGEGSFTYVGMRGEGHGWVRDGSVQYNDRNLRNGRRGGEMRERD